MVDVSQMPSLSLGVPNAVEQRVRQQYGPGGAPVYTLPPQMPSMPTPAAALPSAIQQRVSQQYGPGGMLTAPTTFQQPSVAPRTPPGLPVAPASAPAAAAPKPATGPLGFQPVSQFPPGALLSGGVPSKQAAPTAPQVAAGPHRNLSPHEAQILLSAAMPRVSPQEAALSTVFNVHAGLLSKNLAKADNDYAALMQHAVTPADVAVADKFRSDQYAAHLNPFVEDMKKFGFGWLPQQLLVNQGLQQNQGYPSPDGTVP